MTTTNNQDKLRSHFFDNAETVFILLDKELRLIDANEIFFRVQNINRENIIGKYISDISPDIKSNGRFDLYKKVLKTGKTLLVDEINVRQSSESFYARIKVFKVGDGLGIIAKDISDLKRTIENHRLLEEKYKTIIETTDEMIHQISAEGKIIWANRAWKKYMEADDKDFIGKNLTDFIDDTTKKEFAKILPLILKGDRVDNLSCTFISKNGKLLFLEGETLPIFNNGKITGSQAFLRNVTERKIAEQKITEANKRFTHAARASKEIIYDWDIHNNAIWWNENYYELMGLEYEDKLLDIGSWTKFIHPDDHDRVLKSITDFLEGKENYWFGEYRFLGKKNDVLYFADRGFVIRDKDGKPFKMIGAITDITFWKQNIQHLEEIIFSLSHKVRQPVAHILGISNLLTNETITKEELSKINGYMKESAISLDKFTHELTELVSVTKQKTENKNWT